MRGQQRAGSSRSRAATAWALAPLLVAACGGPGGASVPEREVPNSTGGAAPGGSVTGGSAAGGGGTAMGGATGGSTPGGTANGGTAGTGAGGIAPTGGSGTGGFDYWAGSGGVVYVDTGGSDYVPTGLAARPDVVPLLAEQDTTCLAACEVAVACADFHTDVSDCFVDFSCSDMALKVDLMSETPEAVQERVVACLAAGIAHMKCVAALDCEGFLGWWLEEPTPFPCSAEQTTEEETCGPVGLYF